ncbi:hypothetical protein H633G_09719 [Metarhizium anisopliae BRIP 53284]|nr:hypothetical protein H633G_09719 [Metarhizium anisopliae BRIP 53284]
MVPKAVITLAVAFSAVLAAAATTNKRIIGGEVAKEGDFPFIVRLHFQGNSQLLCEGTLLDSTTVVTAAHCPYDAQRQNSAISSVRAGSLDRETGGVVAEVQSRIYHPDYVHRFKRNDIAILKLSTPIQESQTIRYAKLPVNGADPAVGSTAVAAGWGAMESGGISDKLRKVAVPINAPDQCLNESPLPNSDKDEDYRTHLDTKVCAGTQGKDTGVGDSGGPLIDQATRQLIGITSFIVGGAPAGHAFYTKAGKWLGCAPASIDKLPMANKRD